MKRTNNKGITLVALVVTIVILIILATVTINAVLGDNGLIKQAQKAKDIAENSITKENEDMNLLLEEYANMMAEDNEPTEPDDSNNIEDILKDGDYVYYTDSKDTERKCVVLYDMYSGYNEIQIITMEIVEEYLEIGGWTDYPSNGYEYNTAISDLNNKVEEYMNDLYVKSARCVGTVPNNKGFESEIKDFKLQFEFYYDTYQIRDQDDNYKNDVNKMELLGIKDIETDYWLASRWVDYNSVGAWASLTFGLRFIETNGQLNEAIAGDCGLGDTSPASEYHGLRPVFTLKSNLKVTGGDGSEENPYTLGV